MRRLVVLGFGLWLAAQAAFAAVTLDVATGFTRDNRASGTNAAETFTVAANNNRYLIVGLSAKTTDATGTPVITTVNWNGSAMTQLDANPILDARSSWLYGIVAPATGTHSIDIVFTSGENVDYVVNAASFYNVNQATPTGTFVHANGNNTTATVNVTSAAGELVVDEVSPNSTLTIGGGQTQLSQAASSCRGASSSEAGAASVTMSWTLGGSAVWSISAGPLKPSVGRRRVHVADLNLFDWIRRGGIALLWGKP